nr:MAG TPA: hypothetical protein [Bacteriophage sp.]
MAVLGLLMFVHNHHTTHSYDDFYLVIYRREYVEENHTESMLCQTEKECLLCSTLF